MKSPSNLRLLAGWIAFTLFATWLAAFFTDAKRPTTVQERADLLAAENLLDCSLHAPTPPSPVHWEQRGVLTMRETGERFPLARDISTLALAASGLNRNVAGVVAFGLAGLSLVWLQSRLFPGSGWRCHAVAASLLLVVAHGRAWQMGDPFPFLLLAASAFFLGRWMIYREEPGPRAALWLGGGLAALLLCTPALFTLGAAISGIDLCLQMIRDKRGLRSIALPILALLPALALGLGAARNIAISGSPWTSAADLYAEQNITAPGWIWQTPKEPRPGTDQMLERYDELVAIPGSRWSNPALGIWAERLRSGADLAGGLALTLAALALLMIRPSPSLRPSWLMLVGISFIALACYTLPGAWWTFATPAIAIPLHRLFFERDNMPLRRRMVFGLAGAQLLSLFFAKQNTPSEAEYAYKKYLEQIEIKLGKVPGAHLVFVSFDQSASAIVEPSALPRHWRGEKILYARELAGPENAALVKSMPERTPWRMLISREQLGVYKWSAGENASNKAKDD